MTTQNFTSALFIVTTHHAYCSTVVLLVAELADSAMKTRKNMNISIHCGFANNESSSTTNARVTDEQTLRKYVDERIEVTHENLEHILDNRNEPQIPELPIAPEIPVPHNRPIVAVEAASTQLKQSEWVNRDEREIFIKRKAPYQNVQLENIFSEPNVIDAKKEHCVGVRDQRLEETIDAAAEQREGNDLIISETSRKTVYNEIQRSPSIEEDILSKPLAVESIMKTDIPSLKHSTDKMGKQLSDMDTKVQLTEEMLSMKQRYTEKLETFRMLDYEMKKTEIKNNALLKGNNVLQTCC